MILRQVGETGRDQTHGLQPSLVQPVGRCLHRGMGHACGGHIGQQAVKGNGFGRGVGRRGVERALDAGGADVGSGDPHRLPDLACEAGDAGLAVRPRHRDHGPRLRSGHQGGGKGQGGARILDHDRRRTRGQDRGPGPVGQHGDGPAGQRIGGKTRAVGGDTGQGREQVAGRHGPVVDRQPAHDDIGRPRQTQFRKCLRHPRPPRPRCPTARHRRRPSPVVSRARRPVSDMHRRRRRQDRSPAAGPAAGQPGARSPMPPARPSSRRCGDLRRPLRFRARPG